MVNHPANSSDQHDEPVTTSLALKREPTREEKTREAIDEGHDADIPSNIGFILTETEERKRRASIVSSRRARRSSSVAGDHDRVRGDLEKRRSKEHQDLEKGVSRDGNKDDDDKEEEDEEDDGEETSSSENDIVWWESDNDPENPYNWARWRKVLNCFLVSALTFVTPLASCKFGSLLDGIFTGCSCDKRGHDIALMLIYTTCSYVRPWRSGTDGRIREQELRARLLLRLRVRPGLRGWTHDLCPFV